MERRRQTSGLSPLMVGPGQNVHQDGTNNHELNINMQDFASLITQRSRPNTMFSVIHVRHNTANDTTASAPVQHKSSPSTAVLKTPSTAVPKTQCTRTGSLFLYPNNKVITDNREQFADFESQDNFQIEGHSLTAPPSAANDTSPMWSKLLTPRPIPSSSATSWLTRGSTAIRDRKQYIKHGGTQNAGAPYSWNYAVSPAKLINTRNEADVNAVRGLSEAVLAYRQKTPAESQEFIKTIEDNLKRLPSLNQRKKLLPRRTQEHATRTHDWVYAQHSFVSCSEKEPEPMEQLERARTSLKMSWRVPTNTPIMPEITLSSRTLLSNRSQRKLLGTRGKLKNKSSVPQTPATLTKDLEIENV